MSNSSLISQNDSLTTDSMTTDECLTAIEYNTRMTAQGVSHIFICGMVLLTFLAVWVIIKRWYFGGV